MSRRKQELPTTDYYARGAGDALRLLEVFKRTTELIGRLKAWSPCIKSMTDVAMTINACKHTPTYYWRPELVETVLQASESYPLKDNEGPVRAQEIIDSKGRFPVPSYMPRITRAVCVFGDETPLGCRIEGTWVPYQAVYWSLGVLVKAKSICLHVQGLSWYQLNGRDVASTSFICETGTENIDSESVQVSEDESDEGRKTWFAERDSLLKWVCTASMFIEQDLLHTPTASIHPSTLKHAERQGVDPTCKVVKIRKLVTQSRPDGDGDPERSYSCRWIVNGHWRNQWFPSRSAHAPVWVQPYIKGPDDKPLKPERPTVYSVTR